MANSNFEKLEIWKESKQLSIDIFTMWIKLKNNRIFSLRDQTQRAALSIPSNIAEGSERKSAPEFLRYLYIAKGSAAELRTQLIILKELNLTDEDVILGFIDRTLSLSRRIQTLINRVSSKQRNK